MFIDGIARRATRERPARGGASRELGAQLVAATICSLSSDGVIVTIAPFLSEQRTMPIVRASCSTRWARSE
jgi:hypothetical protein